MPQNSLGTASAMALLDQLQWQVSTIMRYSIWADGAAIPTSSTWMFLNKDSFPSLSTFTGPFHMVSLSSLHLFTSRHLSLEPTHWAHERVEVTQYQNIVHCHEWKE